MAAGRLGAHVWESSVLWTVTHGAADVLLLGLAFDPELADRLVESVLDTTLDGLRAA